MHIKKSCHQVLEQAYSVTGGHCSTLLRQIFLVWAHHKQFSNANIWLGKFRLEYLEMWSLEIHCVLEGAEEEEWPFLILMPLTEVQWRPNFHHSCFFSYESVYAYSGFSARSTHWFSLNWQCKWEGIFLADNVKATFLSLQREMPEHCLWRICPTA